MRRVRATAVCFVVVLAAVFAIAAPAFGSSSVWWGLTSGSWPASLPASAGGVGDVVVTAQNRGYANADGATSPVVLRDVLPAGVRVLTNGKGEPEVEALAGPAGDAEEAFNGTDGRGPVVCSLPAAGEVECLFAGEYERLEPSGPTRTVPKLLPPFEQIEARIKVEVLAGASSSEENMVSVSGGGAAGVVSLSRHISVGKDNAFGVENYELSPEEEGGAVSSQAGVHPFQLTSVLGLNTGTLAAKTNEEKTAGLAKDLSFRLPPGLVGNPTPFPQCTDAQFSTQEQAGEGGTEVHNQCPASTAVGIAVITFKFTPGSGVATKRVPLFNLTPLHGEPARFGFEILAHPTILDTSVRTGGDYGVTVDVHNITQIVDFFVSKVTFWGVPGSTVHDPQRGWACLSEKSAKCASVAQPEPPPLLSLPTSCNGPMSTTVLADAWGEPEPAVFPSAEAVLEGLDGCNHLQFEPEASVVPDGSSGSTPSGVTVGVHLPQEGALDPEGLAESTLKELRLEFPEGVTVNPSSANGLEACTESEIGYLPGASVPPEGLHFTASLPEPLLPGVNFCPNGSKIGEVEIETPLLPNKLKGFVYLATPAPFGEPGPMGETGLNPFGSLISLYIVAKEPVSGTLIKVPVQVSLDPSTGRLVATSRNIPELPFETLRLHMFGEDRAPLSTPGLCGTYTSTATLSPWSGESPVVSPSRFEINSAPNGAPCQDPLPFSPSLTAGTTNNQAGGFSPFTLTMSREDGNQSLKAIGLHMPPGLSGTLAGIALCGEAQADAGTCGPESEIGETTVSVGLGGDPYTVTGGKVYLTGPYAGAPFGLSIVNPADAGPFHLGNVIVRAKIEVDPHTAQLTVTSDASGPYAIPPMIKGIPLQIKHINVTVGRPGFTFNPTNCTPQTITGTLTSTSETTASRAVPFQVDELRGTSVRT